MIRTNLQIPIEFGMAIPREAATVPTVLRRHDADHRRAIVLCARHLRRLAVRRGKFGVTASDTRAIAIAHGFATGREHEIDMRALSWLGAVPRMARLIKTGAKRMNAQRNNQAVYVVTDAE